MALLYEPLHGHFMNFEFMEEYKLTPPTYSVENNVCVSFAEDWRFVDKACGD